MSKKEIRVILPSQDLTARLSEQMVEMDILDVDYDCLLSIAVGGLSCIDRISGYGPHDYVANDLASLSTEYKEVTMHSVPLEQVDCLQDELVSMSEVMRSRLDSLGFNPEDEDRNYPCSYLVEMLPSGDLVIGFDD